MFVGDQDRVERVRIFADRAQAFEGFFAAETRIDQDARAIGADKRAVTGAGCGEDRDLQQSPYCRAAPPRDASGGASLR